MKNITDLIRNDMSCGLRKKFDFKGDVVRRVSLAVNEAMKNHRKSFERKFIVQSNDNESVERNLATARELKKVIMSVLHSIVPLHLILLFVLFQLLDADNPYNIKYIIDPDGLDATHGETVKMDTLVINSDIVCLIKMIYDAKAGWGEEFSETVEEFFHPENLTLSVRSVLGITIE